MLPVLGALTVLSTAVQIAYPLAWKYVIDTLSDLAAGGDETRERIVSAIGIILLIYLGRSLRNIYPMLRARVNGILEMEVRRTYFERILEKGHRFFLTFRTGDLVTRLTDDISGWMKVGWFLCSGIFRAVESGVALLFCVGAMLLVDWRLGLVALAPLPVMMAVWWRVRLKISKRFDLNQQAISRTNDLLESCYSGIRIVKAYNAEERFRAKARALLDERIEVELSLVRLRALLDSMYVGIANFGRVLTMAVGGYWVLDGSLSLGSLYAIFLFVDQLVRPMMDIPQFFISGKMTTVCIDRLEGISGFDAERGDGRGGDRPVDAIARVELQEASFRFDDGTGREALEKVSLAIPRGKRVAVVGPVGSGKTTLARILSGELVPTGGRVLVNETPLPEFDLVSYRRRVGYVPQEPLLFSDTIRENVAFGRGMPEEDVRRALRLARMEEEVESFPKGLDEMLGQRGVRVSGGQRQRLAIARAFAGRPDLVVMDDVTAALDAENEEELWDALEREHPDLTAVIVTHRMATAMRADEILVLDRGRVVDRGTHDDLLERCDLYRRLAHGGDEEEGRPARD